MFIEPNLCEKPKI